MSRLQLEQHLAAQIGPGSSGDLLEVLGALAFSATEILGARLCGVYLTGSFAVGAGDRSSDVDFLVVADSTFTSRDQEGIRVAHGSLPDRPERWAKHLEGSWVSADVLRDPVAAHAPWLYVDNGSREVQSSRHDDTWNGRWLLRHAGISLFGPKPSDLLPEVDPRDLRAEAVEQAELRAEWIRDEGEVLLNGWAQPYVVLTHARLLWAATFGTVASKENAALWAATQCPEHFGGLIAASIRFRREPFDRDQNRADPRLAGKAFEFVDWATREIRERARWT